jgi:hypothetical protein
MRWRELAVFMSACLLVVGAGPAAAAAAPPKRAFVPLNTTVKHVTVDTNRALLSLSKETDLQAAGSFAVLARRMAAVTIAVNKLKGSRGATLTAQRNLVLALATAATDLANVSSASRAHNTARTRTATLALIRDLAPVKAARIRFAKALGIAP